MGIPMRIGVPKEIKEQEFRVGLTPAAVRALTEQGHQVWVETQAGQGGRASRMRTTKKRGAKLAVTPEEIYRQQLVVKVKEPLPAEYSLLHPDLILFTYLHLAASRELTQALLQSGATCLAYETVELADGSLPLLAPMSMIAGRLSVQFGAHYLTRQQGGRGVLLGYLIVSASSSFDVPLAFAGLAALGLMGVLLYTFFAALERYVLSWRQ